MTKKETAIRFLEWVAKGEAKQAFEKYTGDGFRHHNVFFKGDAHSLMAAMEENARQHPEKTLAIQRALEDGDLVAIHSHIQQSAADAGAAVMHIFRFEGNKIVELWDFGQAVPADTINENGMF